MTQQNNTRELAIPGTTNGIIPSDGEVADIIIPQKSVDVLLAQLREGDISLPLHEHFLQEQSPEVQEAVYDTYLGVEARPWSSVSGKVEEVLGMGVFQHGAYQGKDGLPHPEGYYQVLILLNKRDEENRLIVIKSGSESLLFHALHALKVHGWFLFKEPVKYEFSGGGPGSAHRMRNMTNRDLSKLMKK